MDKKTGPVNDRTPAILTDFAPADYTDDRSKLDWETKYPIEARKKIKSEAIYLGLILFVAIAASFFVLFYSNGFFAGLLGESKQHLKGCLCSLFGGIAGGALFSIKWLFHSVAKGIWHLDRRLWRIFTPLMSGTIAFFTLLLIASGLLKIFNVEFINDPLSVLGFSFLIGYFSDKALAKLAEIADFLLGMDKKKKE